MKDSEQPKDKKKGSFRPSLTIILFVSLVLLAVFFFILPRFTGSSVTTMEVSYNDLLTNLSTQAANYTSSGEDGGVLRPEIVVENDKVTFTNWVNQEGEEISLFATKLSSTDVNEDLRNDPILGTTGSYSLDFRQPSFLANVGSFLIGLLPFLLIIGIFFFILRRAQGGSGSGGPFGFGRSRAKVITGARPNVTFYDVAGAEEAKEELKEVVDFLRFPERFQSLGARIPRGVLLVGPPGTGKTLVARAVAGEAGVPFYSISGSEFVEMFVGVGASRVRDLFEQAKKYSPSIIFVDEIDAVGRRRGSGLGGGHDEREQTLNQILVEMDGFDQRKSVIMIAATNRPDVLDPALLRPGRFDRKVVIATPDLAGRVAILEVHTKGKPIEEGVKLKDIATQTPGFSGADLANLVNEAALLAARRKKSAISIDELTESIDRVSMGPARKSKTMSAEERRMVAYHETGHALVSYLMPEGKGVGKVSIVARGSAGGFTRYEQDERALHTLGEMQALIASALGGRAAEEYKFGEVTSGAESDIETATALARNMVTRLGMSTRLGPRSYGKKDGSMFLGKEYSEQRDYSLESEAAIDAEIDRILAEGMQNAKSIVETNSKKLDEISEYLLEHETVEAEAFKKLAKGAKLPDLSGKTKVKKASTSPKARAKKPASSPRPASA